MLRTDFQRQGLPLDGIIILDLTQMLSGPYCTMLLADLGATVVKIEPLTGDPTRTQGPYLAEDTLRSYGGYFQSVNRNKRSIAIDLKRPEGPGLVRKLAARADAIVENFRPGVMDRLGLSYESLSADYPALVYLAIRGFGDPRTGASPYQSWPAFDVVAQAMGGIMSITGEPDGPPVKVGPGVGDIFPAALAAAGLLAVLLRAKTTGRGDFVDVAMYDSVISLCERIIYQTEYTGQSAVRSGSGHPLLAPFGVFPAADGWVTIAAPWDHQWYELCDLMQRPDARDDARYLNVSGRAKYRAEVHRVVTEWTETRTVAAIQEVLAARIPFGPVNDSVAILDDPHLAARQMLVMLDQPGTARTVRVAGSPIKVATCPSPASARAPLLGEHTASILAEVGCAEGEIKELAERGVIHDGGGR